MLRVPVRALCSPGRGQGRLLLPELLHVLQRATDLPQGHPGAFVGQAGPRGTPRAPVGKHGHVVQAAPPAEQLQGLHTAAAVAGRTLHRGTEGGLVHRHLRKVIEKSDFVQLLPIISLTLGKVMVILLYYVF